MGGGHFLHFLKFKYNEPLSPFPQFPFYHLAKQKEEDRNMKEKEDDTKEQETKEKEDDTNEKEHATGDGRDQGK